ncbi:hypothetical protein CEXT_86371 [Caerostris extrusa]|uniref:Uncharacterized protein n=1 Tax=Caerostris extrusa TaxID=172846 RepID=A0AAV4XNP4_CAEEX|nr:hypothetical protein CEXT_86371 [Caerostris extrusa]
MHYCRQIKAEKNQRKKDPECENYIYFVPARKMRSFGGSSRTARVLFVQKSTRGWMKKVMCCEEHVLRRCGVLVFTFARAPKSYSM